MLEQARGATRAWLAAVGEDALLARRSRNQMRARIFTTEVTKGREEN